MYYVYATEVKNPRYKFTPYKKYEVKGPTIKTDPKSVSSGTITDDEGNNVFIIFSTKYGMYKCAVLGYYWILTENEFEETYIYLDKGTELSKPGRFITGKFYPVLSLTKDSLVHVIDEHGEIQYCITDKSPFNCAHTNSTAQWHFATPDQFAAIELSREINDHVVDKIMKMVKEEPEVRQPYLYEVQTSSGEYYIKATSALDFYGQIEDFSEVEQVVPLYEV
ncbi:hypothetical protein BI036_gp024 [Morganella phage vB_MmoM_MP1]|uniref:Uncharacterized protein n=1 Tax=Morganella phage vB_MmoM_MP1 TaxID=1852628 RepID=A0A192YBG8_9CAUD|nr:hypothetical protein BI036_gp024 [Morganella phage vB_MmoM_MP1]ANM46460.1 hypothetical protein MP1_gp0024 [Morganella phage vB_MmoM_MP1]